VQVKDIRKINKSALNIIELLEQFIKDHIRYEENTDLRDSLNQAAFIAGITNKKILMHEAFLDQKYPNRKKRGEKQ